MKDRVLLVGSYPPPYGGCSVHVQRLKHALEDEYRVEVVDLYSEPDAADDCSVVRCGRAKPGNILRAVWAVAKRRSPIVHFHVSAMERFLYAAYPLLAVMPSESRTILTVHGGSFVARFATGPAWRRSMLRDVLRRIHRIVTVNLEQRDFLESIGVPAARLRVVPAYLPPAAVPSPRTQQALSTLVAGELLIVASGCGKSYYGFETILDALAALRASGKRVRALFCTYGSYDEPYVTDLERRISKDSLGTIVRDFGPDEFASILERCDAYVRATDRDGDAVAIREALHYGKPVVASDCVERPARVRLFRTGDVRSLEQALMVALRESAGAATDCSTGLDALVGIYREMLAA